MYSQSTTKRSQAFRPSSGQGTDSGARTRDRRIPADLRAHSLATVPPTPLSALGDGFCDPNVVTDDSNSSASNLKAFLLRLCGEKNADQGGNNLVPPIILLAETSS
ncbi:hypothetical protein PoB_001700800 [Plakobranchus ocellatus]|uniref:Uncharacterized protein n=1 Tax=Plakobranchus ocellatus TaxID=259542 RepID=A0AAV3Z7S8_9GAST|nr:hypothetical protein PoB_001700800 [Plakobranchus ocellatus]